jgi:hypothetical protein
VIPIRTEVQSDQKKTVLDTEADAQRKYDCNLLGTRKYPTIEITRNPTAYSLQPFTCVPSQPVVFRDPGNAVSQKGESLNVMSWKVCVYTVIIFRTIPRNGDN